MFQDPLKGTAPNMTIEENLALAYMRASSVHSPFSMINKADRATFRERLSQLDLGLEDRMNHPVGLLSGGQRQALTLLMATLQKPKLLLLDEHTAALDPKTAAKVLEATQKIVSKDNLTTMMITHNMRDAITYGNRLIMMYDGHIVVDVSGEQKKNLTVEQLLNLFSQASGSDEVDDKLVLG
jgi:putative ABC transport system ATP-binding protein